MTGFAEWLGLPKGPAVGVRALRVAEEAARWVVYAGARIVAEGVVGLDGETAQDRALEVLDQLVADRNLSPVEVRGLRCRVFGPDGVGEVDGREW